MNKPIGLCVIGAGAIAARHMEAFERLGGVLPRWVVSDGEDATQHFARRWEFAKAGTSMDFIANGTSSIFAQGWTPELQKMVGGKQDAAGLLKAVQAEYKKEIAG